MYDDASDDIEPNHILIPVKNKAHIIVSFFSLLYDYDIAIVLMAELDF